MNRNLALFSWMLAGLLVLSALLNGFLIVQQMSYYRMLDATSAQISQSQVAQTENLLRTLFSELTAYGQKEPSIYEVLKKYGVQPPPATPSSSRTGSRPPAR